MTGGVLARGCPTAKEEKRELRKQARKLHERDWLAPACSVLEPTGDPPTCCTTVDSLIRELEENKFDAVFLDHDLCWEDAAYSEQTFLSSD